MSVYQACSRTEGPVATITGAYGTSGPTRYQASRTTQCSTSLPARAALPVSGIAGRPTGRWELATYEVTHVAMESNRRVLEAGLRGARGAVHVRAGECGARQA